MVGQLDAFNLVDPSSGIFFRNDESLTLSAGFAAAFSELRRDACRELLLEV